MEEDFLSKLIDADDIQIGENAINLIVAPCGSGKTTLAVDNLVPMLGNPKKCLYLIDTTAGRDQLAGSPKCQIYDPQWRKNLKNVYWYPSDKLNVMTYAAFGTLCLHQPNWFDGLDLIICDEFHSFIEMMQWEMNADTTDIPNSSDGKNYKAAWDGIINGMAYGKIGAVVAMTATPKRVYEYVNATWMADENRYVSPLIYEVPVHGIPKQYKPEKITEYHNLVMLCHQLPADQKGIIYVPHITQMTTVISQMCERGIRGLGIWSPQNQNWKMSEEQQNVRQHLIETQTIPEDVDVLFINKSCETSINIKSPIDYMVIHSSDPDVITQAMGRYRGNVKHLYVFNPNITDEFVLPETMIGTKVFVDDLNQFIEENSIRDSNGRLIGHIKLLEFLEVCGYQSQQKKIPGGKRYYIITLKPEPDTQN